MTAVPLLLSARDSSRPPGSVISVKEIIEEFHTWLLSAITLFYLYKIEVRSADSKIQCQQCEHKDSGQREKVRPYRMKRPNIGP